jgi:hypothetical protein
MRSMTRFVVAVSFLAFLGIGLSVVQAADQKQTTNPKQTTDQKQTADPKQTTDQKQCQGQEQWRYTFRNGEWWYWLPAGRWVYWRDNRWNTYDPKNFTSRNCSGVVATNRNGSTDGNRVATESDVRPFYGHALSDADRRPVEANNEVGPFYGHALPSEVIGRWRDNGSVRPFYGHAVSAAGD